MNRPSDAEPERLLILAKAGDGAALGMLLECYRTYLTLLVRLQVGRKLQVKLDIDDVVQETFLEVHRGFGAFRGGSEREFVAWIRQILGGVLANLVRHYYGTKRRDVRLERELNQDLDRSSEALDRCLVAPDSSPSREASKREQAILLANALACLSPDYRDVIILRQLEDLTFPEVARRMGRTEDSVKNLWVRALARLRHAVDDSR